jgi:hypothetical protein
MATITTTVNTVTIPRISMAMMRMGTTMGMTTMRTVTMVTTPKANIPMTQDAARATITTMTMTSKALSLNPSAPLTLRS